MDQALLVTLSAVAGVVVVGLLVGLVVALVAGGRGRRRLEAELAAARADVDGLRAQVDDLARTVPPPPADHAAPGREYVITSISDEAAGAELAVPATTELTGREFVSVAAGESLVRVRLPRARRTTGAVGGEPQPDPLRDAPGGQALAAAAAA